MAIEPLYNDKSVLISKLRMSITQDADTLAVVDTAISQVRSSFFARLTLSRAMEIVGYTQTDNPTTAEENLRSLAGVTEVLWVSWFLIQMLPAMHLETQYAIKNDFGDQPLTRDAPSLQKYMNSLYATIQKNLGLLIVPEEPTSGDVKAFSTGAVTPVLIADNFIGNPI
jgi:hypothetical protein